MPWESVPLADIDHFATKEEVFGNLDELARHYFKSIETKKSICGEFEHLERLMSPDVLGIDRGFVVDMAASDGVSESCTLKFFRDHKWPGLAIEMDPKLFSKLAFIYAKFPQAQLARGRVTPHNVDSMLNAFEVPKDFALLNLDIDSYDLHVLDSILESGFKPKVISMEINEKIPPPIYFSVDYSDTHYWQGDHFYGCSLAAATEIVKPRGYVLESVQYNNAVFVESSIAHGKIEDLDAAEAYHVGYANKPDRKSLFKWNDDVECLHGMGKEESVAFVTDLFSKYAGSFTVR